jgi:serine/threonine protein kinase
MGAQHRASVTPLPPAGPAGAPSRGHGWVQPGLRLGDRFVVQEAIGAGAEAVVVRARDEQLRTSVAVKLLRSGDADLQRRFVREAEMLANVQHPAIVRVFAHGRDGGALYMALELLAGPNLGQRLAASGPLPWRQVVEIGIQIAEALDAVHRKGLIHRDVKPGNIMLAEHGDPTRVKLIDFGCARVTESYRDPSGFVPEPRRRTGLGLAIGTPGYLPLEAGLAPADERFDVFALGATLYELLTGQLPGVEPLRSLHEVDPRCDAPADLGLVLAAALALEPGDRTQSAAELGCALAAIRNAHPERRTSSRLDGRYELISVLGTGGKGEVYLANHRGSGHDLALKFLRSTHPDDRLRFEREAKLLALLDVPGLPRFFDYAPEAVPPYIAMACATGVPAARFCLASDQIRLTFVEVVEVGRQLARVLAQLHSRGVLHRDVNANNVLIDLQRAPKVTLIDLGSAALTDLFHTQVPLRYRTPPEARVEIPDGGLERLAWSAPETRTGAGWTDRSDVYSLGVLLYRLLTGKLPTQAGSDELVPVQRHAPACPPELARVVACMLQPRPADRPDAAQLGRSLRDILEDEADDELADTDTAATSSAVFAASSRSLSARRAPSEPTPAVAPGPPASTPRERPRRRLAVGLASVALVVGAWWLGRVTAELPVAPVVTAPSVAPLPTPTKPPPPPIQVQVSPPPTPPLPTMRAALDAVGPHLRACSSPVGGISIEYETAPARERFARFSLVGDHAASVERCVHAVLAELRFEPTAPRTFHEVYLP